DAFGGGGVRGGVVGGDGGQAVDVAVVHAERGGDQDGVVDLHVGGAGVAGGGDQVGGDLQAAALDRAGDGQQRAQLRGDRGLRGVGPHLVHQGHPLGQLGGGERGVRGGAEHAVVAARDVGGDQLPLAPAEGVLAAQQHLGQVV